ncbi:Exocyst complex component SEC5 [[Candida] zeylanoides]
MDFLNANFTSLDDLGALDRTIATVEASKHEIAAVVASRGDTDAAHDAADPADPAAASDPVVRAAAHAALETIRAACAAREELPPPLRHLPSLAPLARLLDDRAQAQRALDAARRHSELEAAIVALPTDGTLERYRPVHAALAASPSPALTSLFEAKLLHTKTTLQSALESRLAALKWLDAAADTDAATDEHVRRLVDALVNTQVLYAVPHYPHTWWALDSLVKPFVTRFNFHFDTSRPTNKVSKPEWCFEYLETFLRTNLQRLERAAGASLAQHHIVAYATITSLLVPVRAKMVRVVDQINGAIERQRAAEGAGGAGAAGLARGDVGRLLSHLIFELSAFDQRLRNAYQYNPHVEVSAVASADAAASGPPQWSGLTGDVMLNQSQDGLAPVASNWLSLESQLARSRFEDEIVGAANAFDIDLDYSASAAAATRPTFSAFNLSKLFDNLTSHYRTLSIVKYQLKYVSNIQLDLLDEYCNALASQLRSTASAKARRVLKFVPRAGAAPDADGSALVHLCSVWCSAQFLVEKMELWSEELVFVQLWDAFKTISGTATSFRPESTIFDDTVERYAALVAKVGARVEAHLEKQIRAWMKGYVNDTRWDVPDDDAEEVSGALAALLQGLPVQMGYLARGLSHADYFVLSGKVCSMVAKTFVEFVITNNSFSAAGTRQLQVDVDHVVRQLGAALHLAGGDYDNRQNRDYVKLRHSVELLRGVPRADVRFFGAYDTYPTLRERFESRLESLSDFEVYDLLHRIR